MRPNSVLKVLCNVSVRTKVPEMNVTPSTMARAVNASRSLWAKRPRRTTLFTSTAQLLHVFENRICRGREQLIDNGPVGQEDHTIGIGGSPGIVRDHHDGL